MSQNKCVKVFWKAIGTGDKYKVKSRAKDRVCKTARDEVLSHKNKVTYNLYKCPIVKVDKKKRLMELTNCGYQTKTTKSRLNELLREAGSDKQIVQRKGVWQINGQKFQDKNYVRY